MQKVKVRVAVIGLGRIGSAFDADRDHGPPFSHVGTILRDPGLQLAAVCDVDAAARDRFKRTWKASIPIYESTEAMLAATAYDIIVIAIPTAFHEKALSACLKAGPKAVYCEKPMCGGAAVAAEVAARYDAAAVPLLVNYHRRWDQRFAALRSALSSAGRTRSAHMVYVKGLRNYGAHAVDLLQNLFGRIVAVKSGTANSHDTEDPSFSAILQFSDGLAVSLAGVDGLDYELFDLDIVAERARYRVEFGGQSIRQQLPQADRHFPGYTSLSEEERLVLDGPVHGMTEAYRELAGWVIEKKPPSVSTAANAVSVHRVLDAIVASAAASGKEIAL